MFDFTPATSLRLAQLLTLLATTEKPPLLEQASRHLMGQSTYVNSREVCCAATGHLVTVTREGAAIRKLLDGLCREGVRLTAAQLKVEAACLLLDRLDRWSLGETKEDIFKGMLIAMLIDSAAAAALQLGVSTPPHWTWWDADVVDVPLENSQWLIRRAENGGSFGKSGEAGQAAYLCGDEGDDVWVTRVDADITTVKQAQDALARRTLLA